MKSVYLLLALLSVLAAAILFSYSPFPWKSQVLTAGVFVGLAPLLREIITAVRHRVISLELPIVVTILILVFLGQLPVASLFVLLILVGQLFKSYISYRVQQAIAGMAESLPHTAFLLRGNDVLKVKISQIAPGDILVVKAGGRAAVDGILLDETGNFDESIVSGESRPVIKKAGEKVIAGSINLGDEIKFQSGATFQNSTIAQIQKMVRESQSQTASLSRFSDNYAKLTAVAALIMVVITYLFSRDILHSLAVWVALVPVVFAIIVPVATTIGIALLAKSGVLVKTARALEMLTRAGTVVFDKTGTLTYGRPQIESIIAAPPFTLKDLLRLVGSLEKFSEHHLADPVIARCQKEKIKLLPAADVHVVKGAGIVGRVGSREVLVGNKQFLVAGKISVPSAGRTDNTIIYAAVDRKYAGSFSFSDQLRPEAVSVVTRLKDLGLRIVILTGDNPAVGQKIAADLGVSEIYSDLKPKDKITHIKNLQKNHRHTVVMVGDGINDAPALARADVGIAMGLRGVDITLESAKIVLVNDNLAYLPGMIGAARGIFKIIKTNLILATVIHLLTAILVMANIIGILGSAVFHEISSVLVLANTMRLFTVKPPLPPSRSS